jgi:drug/metabolite transporter (DMT)-like permease
MTPRRGDATLSPRAALFISLLCMLFGANGVAIKIGFTGIGIFSSAVIRFLLASIAISLWARHSGRSFRITGRQGCQLLLFTLLFSIQLSGFYLGLSRTTASRGALIVNLLPFFIMLLAHHFIPGERITLRGLVGMAFGFGGVFCLFAEGNLSTALQAGDLLILGATIVWACNTIYLKGIIHTFDPFQVVLYSMLGVLPIVLVEALVFDPYMIHDLTPPVMAALAYQGLVTASFGFVAWNQMIARYGPVPVHSFVFIMPVTGVLMGNLLLDERMSPNLLTALVLIVFGLLVTHIRQGGSPVFR